MKNVFKQFVAAVLGWQVRRLTRRRSFKIIAVVGSVGKTSTKFAIANVLKHKYKTLYQEGNYNDLVFVPLVIFEQAAPNIFNPFGWLRIFISNEIKIKKAYPYEIVVLELGTDAPGQIKQFAKYLRPNISVLTSVSPEHMEFFADMAAVAAEELSVADFSDKFFVNKDMLPDKFWGQLPAKTRTYGIVQEADARMSNIKFKDFYSSFDIFIDGKKFLSSDHDEVTEPQLYSIIAAAAVANELGMAADEMDKAIKDFRPVSGRMQRLKGVNDSLIIDDTYNASPEAMKAAIKTLYRLEAPQKIAVLGNMNELGQFSQDEHKAIGEMCDPKKLDLVVTIGPDANKYLAPAAEAQGCQVKIFDSPYTAGEYLKDVIEKDAAILVKGSQNRVFAEETVKLILANPADNAKLVRQSAYWMRIKRKAFDR